MLGHYSYNSGTKCEEGKGLIAKIQDFADTMCTYSGFDNNGNLNPCEQASRRK